MHTIDLLKGEGLPAKTTLGSVFVTALVFVLPLVIMAIMLGSYAINSTNLDIKEREKERLKKEIASYQSDSKQVSEQVKEKNLYIARLNEVSKCVDTYIPWTPVLISLAQNIPDQIRMENLSASNVNTGAMKQASDPNKPLTIPIPQKKMTAEISGQGQEAFNVEVRNYEKKLRAAELLQPYFQDLKYSIEARAGSNQVYSCTMSFTFQKQKK